MVIVWLQYCQDEPCYLNFYQSCCTKCTHFFTLPHRKAFSQLCWRHKLRCRRNMGCSNPYVLQEQAETVFMFLGEFWNNRLFLGILHLHGEPEFMLSTLITSGMSYDNVMFLLKDFKVKLIWAILILWVVPEHYAFSEKQQIFWSVQLDSWAKLLLLDDSMTGVPVQPCTLRRRASGTAL